MSDASYAPDDELDPNDEERARARGWKPLEEWKGPPEKWRSLEEFLRVGEDPRVLAEENRRLGDRLVRVERRTERELTELRKTAEEQTAAITALTALARRADKAGYERARAELIEQRKLAVETGDTSAFDQIEEQIGVLDTERRAAAVPEAPAKAVIDPAISAFFAANADWFVPGTPIHKAMLAHFDLAEKLRPNDTTEQQLAFAKQRLVADFPSRFPQMAAPAADDDDFEPEPAPRRRAPNVAAPSPPPRRPGRQPTGWDTIEDPQERGEAQAAFAAIKRADPGMTEGEYLEIYNNPRADEIALREARKA